MFGSNRTIPALLVVAAHTATDNVGIASVFGFYMLSGCLMTLAARGIYAGRLGALHANRA